MSTKSKVDLYIANDLEELNKRVDDNPMIEKAKSSTVANLSKLVDTTWAEAKKAEAICDEERAYILYMRTFECFKILSQARDVANNKDTVQYYKKGIEIWLEKVEKLQESLKERYDVKNAAKIEAERKLQAEIDEENSLKGSILPNLLYKYIYERKKNILLIDMRSQLNYEQSHLKTFECIHISPDLMNGKGWTSWNVESTLTDPVVAAKFKQRANYEYIVLFDEDSYADNLKAGSCLLGLKQAISIYDRDVKLKHEPLILHGGYEDWMTSYPVFSTAPLLTNKSDGGVRSFEVSYPDDVISPEQVFDDATIVVQPEVVESLSPAIVPQIDRTRKPINNQKPESPVIETKEFPVKSTEIEQPQIPDRSAKPIPPAEPPRPTLELPNEIIPETPKPVVHQEIKKDPNQENLPLKRIIPNRDELSIYRPFNRTAPIDDKNSQYQIGFDAVTGRKIFYDKKNQRVVPNISENEISKPIIPPINRESKPFLTEQDRRQIAQAYQANTDHFQINRRTGLKNLGNSCYMNAIIQSLSFIPRLTNYFLSGEFHKSINSQNKFGSGGMVVREWFRMMLVLCAQQYTYIVPYPFKQTVGKLQRAYLDTQQQDAHEFLIFLLDALHEDLNQATRPRIDEIKSENYHNDDNLLAAATKQAFRLHNQSHIIDLFYGLFKSTTICQYCSYKSLRFEPFAIISVPIQPVRQSTLHESLELFRQGEQLRGDERYECSHCKSITDKDRRFDIWELPKIFIVHFKRFRLHQSRYIKNETLIRYPTSNVNFSRWSLNPSKETYSLIAVINHFGSMNSGHYTSYCNDGKQWYYCDDQSIRSADQRELESNVHAYLLFYSSLPFEQIRLPLISK